MCPGSRPEDKASERKFYFQQDTNGKVTMVKRSVYSLTEQYMMEYREGKQPRIPKSINEGLAVLEILKNRI